MRIRQMFESFEAAGKLLSVDDMAAMQMDRLSLPAQEDLHLLQALLGEPRQTEQAEAARQALLSWDAQATAESVGTTVYRHFMTEWCASVSAARFSQTVAPLLAGGLEPLARRLLAGPYGWFPSDGARLASISKAFDATVGHIVETLGPDPAGWAWGNLHIAPFRHVLSALGDGSIAVLLNNEPHAVGGDMTTLGNTGQGPQYIANTGAGYRHVADLGASPPGLWLVDGQSQSGQVHTRHYNDQLEAWESGKLGFVPLGPDYKGKTTTVLRSVSTFMPTAGAARVERLSEGVPARL